MAIIGFSAGLMEMSGFATGVGGEGWIIGLGGIGCDGVIGFGKGGAIGLGIICCDGIIGFGGIGIVGLGGVGITGLGRDGIIGVGLGGIIGWGIVGRDTGGFSGATDFDSRENNGKIGFFAGVAPKSDFFGKILGIAGFIGGAGAVLFWSGSVCFKSSAIVVINGLLDEFCPIYCPFALLIYQYY